ncbi:MAG: HAD family hydrolase, partial [Actinomycetota bacterium]
MPETLRARAILFDMDGTLVNSDGAVRRIWANFADRFGLDVDEIQKTSHGVKMIETIHRWAPAGTDELALQRELQAIEVADLDGIEAVPGALLFMASLPADR